MKWGFKLNVMSITVLLMQLAVSTALGAVESAADDSASGIVAAIDEAAIAGAGANTQLDPDKPDERLLQKAGARIGHIDIEVIDVFDPDNPQENGVLYRAANALHATTRDNTVRTQLLFQSGDRYNRHVLDETARNLRANSYLNDASITPVKYNPDDNSVDVLVRVHDVWTFTPGVSYGRSGGANHSGVQLSEGNLLGYGKSVSLQTSQDADRREAGFAYTDPNLLSSRWQLDTGYMDASDGGTAKFSIARPFFALDTRRSGKVDFLREQRIDKRYQLGVVVDQYQTTHETYGGQFGWSTGLQDGWVRRWLLGYQVDHLHYRPDPTLGTLQLPPEQRFAYPWLGLAWFEDHYQVELNRDQIGRTEDVYYGRSIYVQIGDATAGLGSDTEAWLAQLLLQDAWQLSERQSVFVTASLDGRHQGGLWRGTLLTATVRYDFRRSRANLFTAKFSSDYGVNLDSSQPLYLGDDDGLRGYPLHYRSGTQRNVLTIEQRLYTDWQILRLLTVGGVAFVDIGRIGGSNALIGDGSHTLADVGIGLRFGSIRSSSGEVFHLNLAYPLNAVGTARKLQWLVVTKQSF